MLEIFLIIYLSKKLGKIYEDKGYKKGWYIAMFVISWIVFEVSAMIVGFIILGEESFIPYLIALLGAGLAYLLNYLFAQSLQDRSNKDPRNEFIITND